VESAHKVVVEPRLKGAGMHWVPDHVNPMVALRTLLCNDRWPEDWPKVTAQLSRQATAQKRALQHHHQAAQSTLALPADPPGPPQPQTPPLAEPAPASNPTDPVPTPLPPSKPRTHRPAPNHPWRLASVGRARFKLDPFANN
jgi:hypothetical protein